MILSYKMMKSPIGRLTLIADDKALVGIHFENSQPDTSAWVEDKSHPILVDTEHQLQEYFAGKRKSFSLKLDMRGTEFQKNVWKALLTIPFGETRSYGFIAKQIKKAKASRAVGAANGCNPIPIVVPCHRVIGANGTLTGFGGGLDVKEKLLKLEGCN